MAKKNTTQRVTAAKVPYYQRRARDLKAAGKCTTCGQVKDEKRKVKLSEVQLPPKVMKELADAPSWKLRLARARAANACYACGQSKAEKAEAKPKQPKNAETFKKIREAQTAKVAKQPKNKEPDAMEVATE